MPRGAQRDQARPDQRSGRKVERRLRVTARDRVELGGIARVQLRRRQVGCAGKRHLIQATVARFVARSQRFVPFDDLPHAVLEGGPIEHPVETQGDEQMMDTVPGLDLFEKPESALRKRRRPCAASPPDAALTRNLLLRLGGLRQQRQQLRLERHYLRLQFRCQRPFGCFDPQAIAVTAQGNPALTQLRQQLERAHSSSSVTGVAAGVRADVAADSVHCSASRCRARAPMVGASNSARSGRVTPRATCRRATS